MREILLKHKVQTVQDVPKHFVSKETPAFRFFVSIMLAQGISYKRIWSVPTELEKRIGVLDAPGIVKYSEAGLEEILFRRPALHRYRKVAGWLKRNCELLLREYNGNPVNIWKGQAALEIERRFLEFEGVGKKKAHMALRMMVQDGAIIKDLENIDIAYDRHVRRVFLRTGLAEKDNEKEIIEAARKINPEYPGALDEPVWDIGINYCHERKPDCLSCPLSKHCRNNKSSR